jgi:hypothetical protein
MDRYSKPILVLALLVFSIFELAGQQSGQLGQFENLPQVVYANPALRPTGKINFGIPALSNIYVNHNNNWFIPKNGLQVNGDGTAQIDTEAILDDIGDFADLTQGVGLELFHAGFGIGDHYFHVRANERTRVRIQIPEDVFNFAVYGNLGSYEFEDGIMDFSDLDVDAIHYREYAVGYNYRLNQDFSLGIAAKYLYGMERIFTEESSLRVRTDPETYALQSSGSYEVNTSGIYSLFEGDESIQSNTQNYLFGLDNRGFGVDLGAVYRLNEKISLEFAANDLGFINWKTDLATYRTDDASFLYEGVDLTDFIFLTGSEYDDALENEVDSLLDDLENTFGFDREEKEFRTSLNGYFRYAGSYQLYESEGSSGKAWANVVHGVGQSTIPFSVALGYNQKVGRWLQAGAHLSKTADLPISLGGGLVLNAGPVQFYCLAENIRFATLTEVTIVDEDSGDRTTLTYFNRPSDIRVHFGINLTFGRSETANGSEPIMR